MSHNANVPAQDIDDDEPDPVIAKLKKTGCLEKHYAVLVIFYAQSKHLCSNFSVFAPYRSAGTITRTGESARMRCTPSETA